MAVIAPTKRSAPVKLQQERKRSFGVHGARLFNMLPMSLRNEGSSIHSTFRKLALGPRAYSEQFTFFRGEGLGVDSNACSRKLPP